MNHLVITADDFGLSEEVNEAIEVAHRTGLLRAAGLMVAGPAALDAVRRARRLPELRIGLHIVLVEGRPALPPAQISDLVDGRGNLRADMFWLGVDIIRRSTVRRQIAAEIAAQFELFRATGLLLDHVSGHKHFHIHPAVAASVLAIGPRYGMRALRVPQEPATVLARVEPATGSWSATTPWAQILRIRARRAGVITPDAVFGLRWSGAMTAARLQGLLGQLPRGLIEIYMHPAVADRFEGHASGYRYRDEFEALCDPASRAASRKLTHRIAGYGDVPAPDIAAIADAASATRPRRKPTHVV
ncbi:MAG: hopanoid biosynthesis-associated protein HpnK [Methylocella sp.]